MTFARRSHSIQEQSKTCLNVPSHALQALSARSNAPECHIGQADRFRQQREGDFGTGLFKHKGSLGPQGISTKPSLPSYSLGASTRDQMYKVKSTRKVIA